MTPTEIKKALVASGFEFLRTLPDGVVLAERVRENQILDSGVRVRKAPSGFVVSVIMRAERRDYPNDTDEQLYARVRDLGAAARSDGFEEREARISVVHDPVDAERVLDTFYEIVFERVLVGEWSDVVEPLRRAVRFEKTVAASRD